MNARRLKKMLFGVTLAGGTVFGFLPGCLEESILNLVTPLLIY